MCISSASRCSISPWPQTCHELLRLKQFARDQMAAFAAGGGWAPRGVRPLRQVARRRSSCTSCLRCGSCGRPRAGYNQIPVDQWLPFAPYFWVPLFAVLFAAVVLAVGPKRDRVARRMLLSFGSAWLTLTFVRVRPVAVPRRRMAVQPRLLLQLLPRADAALPHRGGVRLGRRAELLSTIDSDRDPCAVAVLGPVAWIYRSDSGLRVAATGYRDDSYIATFIVMGSRASSRRFSLGCPDSGDRCSRRRRGILRGGLRRRRKPRDLVEWHLRPPHRRTATTWATR